MSSSADNGSPTLMMCVTYAVTNFTKSLKTDSRILALSLLPDHFNDDYCDALQIVQVIGCFRGHVVTYLRGVNPLPTIRNS